MKKLMDKMILFIISASLGLIIMTQYTTSQSVLGKNTGSDDKSTELNSEMEKLNSEKSDLRDEIYRLKDEIKANEQKATDRENELTRIKEDLNKQKILSGYYGVKGPGVIIKVGQEPNSYISLASSHQYILALISYLNNAGVEAISINGQRYTNYTEIVPVLDHINVNGVALVLPLEIKAIGNKRTIDASLNFVGGIVSIMKEIGFTINTEYTDEVVINSFDGEKEFKYAVPVDAEKLEP